MGEAVIIVIIVILLITFGFVMYGRWATASIKVKAAVFREEDAYRIASITANLTELHCSRNNVVELNCYDTLKIKALTTLIGQSRGGTTPKDSYLHYASLFKNSRIVVYEIFPHPISTTTGDASDTPFRYVIYDVAPAEITQRIPARIPIILYNPLTEESRFGVIEVVRYY
jgi:hypothetical protein